MTKTMQGHHTRPRAAANSAMTMSSLGPFFPLAFGLGWGLAASALLFRDQVEALFGPISGTNPLFILAV